LAEVAVPKELFRKILRLVDDPRPRPVLAYAKEIDGQSKSTEGVCLDDGKYGQMAFQTPPTDENRAIQKAEAGNLSNGGAIWVTSPWKPSYLEYIGFIPL
jgi:hypothetical protein